MPDSHTDDPALATASRVGNNEKSSHRGESIDQVDAVPTYDPTPAAVTHPWNDEKSSLGGGDDDHEAIDDVHAGLMFPTEEEKLTLRRVADTIPWGAYSKLGSHIAVSVYSHHFSASDCHGRIGREVLGKLNALLSRLRLMGLSSIMVLPSSLYV